MCCKFAPFGAFSTQVSIFLYSKRMRRWKVSHVRTVYVWSVYFRACKLCHLEQKQTEKWHFGGRRKTGFLFVTSPWRIHRCQKQLTATFLLQTFFSCDSSLVWNWQRPCKKTVIQFFFSTKITGWVLMLGRMEWV